MQQLEREIKMGIHQPKARSLAGPLILIAVGVLFLIHNLTGFDLFQVLRRYWPLILIVIGISKLLEYFRQKP